MLGSMVLVLAGEEADWTVKKGAVWWFSSRVRQGETQTVLRAVIPVGFGQTHLAR